MECARPSLIFIHKTEITTYANFIADTVSGRLSPSNAPEIPFPLNLSTGADWAEAEFGSIDLGDSRCSRRLVALFASMFASPGKSIPQCTGSIAAARAFYRVLDDELFTDTLIFETHRAGKLHPRLPGAAGPGRTHCGPPPESPPPAGRQRGRRRGRSLRTAPGSADAPR
jgi:hypothetical protein